MPQIHLVNPSAQSFGVAVITPRWLFVLAAATGTAWGTPRVVDETLEPLDLDTIQPATSSGSAFTRATRAAGTRSAARPAGAARTPCSAAFTPRSFRKKCSSSAARMRSCGATAI